MGGDGGRGGGGTFPSLQNGLILRCDPGSIKSYWTEISFTVSQSGFILCPYFPSEVS